MQDESTFTERRPDTQSGWSSKEIAAMKLLAAGSPRKALLLQQFPGHTLGAIKQRLFLVRRELGLPKRGNIGSLRPRQLCLTMLDPDDPGLATPSWQDQQRPAAALASKRYLEALAAA